MKGGKINSVYLVCYCGTTSVGYLLDRMDKSFERMVRNDTAGEWQLECDLGKGWRQNCEVI